MSKKVKNRVVTVNLEDLPEKKYWNLFLNGQKTNDRFFTFGGLIVMFNDDLNKWNSNAPFNREKLKQDIANHFRSHAYLCNDLLPEFNKITGENVPDIRIMIHEIYGMNAALVYDEFVKFCSKNQKELGLTDIVFY